MVQLFLLRFLYDLSILVILIGNVEIVLTCFSTRVEKRDIRHKSTLERFFCIAVVVSTSILLHASDLHGSFSILNINFILYQKNIL